MEKVVAIYVTKEFRGMIKAQKRELTYEQYLNNLIKNSAITPSSALTGLFGPNLQSANKGSSSLCLLRF